jgi:hypothetical protein
MVVVAGAPDFGPEFWEALRKALQSAEPVLEQNRKNMAAFVSQLSASGVLAQQQESMRKLAATMAPALANLKRPTVSPETLAGLSKLQSSISRSIAAWSKLPLYSAELPSFSLVKEFGAAALKDPVLARLVEEARDATPELAGEVGEFSMAAALKENLAPELISAGIYVVIQLVWLAVALFIAGYAPLAGPLLEILGLKSDLAGKAASAYMRKHDSSGNKKPEDASGQ